MKEDSLTSAIGTVYDMAAGAGSWSSVLKTLSCALNCHFAAAISTNTERTLPQSVAVVGIDAGDHSEFLKTWHKRSVWGARRPARVAGEVVSSCSIIAWPELLRTEMFNVYLKPRGIDVGLRLDILCSPGQSQSVSLARRWSIDGFTDREIGFAHAVVPHLRRASALMVRLRHTEMMSASALGALDALHVCVLLIDRAGRIVHASAAAEDLLREADGLMTTRGSLLAATPAATARLTALLARSAGEGGRLPTSCSMRLGRPSGKPDLSLIAMPMPRAHEVAPWADPILLLHIGDPLADSSLDVKALDELFGLTSAEASLANKLLKGMTAADVASTNGRSLATVRTHLASLLAKTGARRQNDLMRLLSRLPPARR